MSLQIRQKIYDKCGQYFDEAHLNDFFRLEAIGNDWIIVRGEDDGKPQGLFGQELIATIEYGSQNQKKIIENKG